MNNKIFIVTRNYENDQSYEDYDCGKNEFVCACTSLKAAQECIKKVYNKLADRSSSEEEYIDDITELRQESDTVFSWGMGEWWVYEYVYTISEVPLDDVDPNYI